MRFSLLLSLSVILALGLGLVLAGASLADRDDGERRARAETLVVGGFGCSDFQSDDGPRQSGADWTFGGWEGVGVIGPPPEHQPLHTFLEARGNFGATCRSLTQEVQSVAQAGPEISSNSETIRHSMVRTPWWGRSFQGERGGAVAGEP